MGSAEEPTGFLLQSSRPVSNVVTNWLNLVGRILPDLAVRPFPLIMKTYVEGIVIAPDRYTEADGSKCSSECGFALRDAGEAKISLSKCLHHRRREQESFTSNRDTAYVEVAALRRFTILEALAHTLRLRWRPCCRLIPPQRSGLVSA